MRLKEGAHLEVIDPETQSVYSAVIQSTKSPPVISIFSKSSGKNALSPVSCLFFANCKSGTNEWVLEKACELAVSNVIIWQADHSVAKLKSTDEIQNKLKRWNKICEAASKQSGNPNTCRVHFSTSLEEALSISNTLISGKATAICCSLSKNSIPFKELKNPGGSFTVIIGPEGDLSSRESKIAADNKMIFLNLGPYTLRAETAAITAISGINSLFGYTATAQ